MTHNLAAPTPTLQAAAADYPDWHAPRASSLRHRQDIRRMLLAFAAAVDAERSLDQVAREDCTTLLRAVSGARREAQHPESLSPRPGCLLQLGSCRRSD